MSLPPPPPARPAPRLIDVGPRDGLENEKKIVPLDAKVAFIDALSDAGIKEIEAGSFANPKQYPNMAGSEQVFARIKRRAGTVYSALVPSVPAFELAAAVNVDKITVLASASETFSRKLTKASIRDTVKTLAPLVAVARSAKVPVKVHVSAAFWCPYEGKVSPEQTTSVLKLLSGIGISEFSIGDTVGKASPDEVRRLLFLALKVVTKESVSLHLHNTFGRAVANALVAWKSFGVTGFEGSAGAAGGCPYTPGALGNVATEALLSAFKAAGGDTGVDEAKLKAAAAGLFTHLGRPAGARPPR